MSRTTLVRGKFCLTLWATAFAVVFCIAQIAHAQVQPPPPPAPQTPFIEPLEHQHGRRAKLVRALAVPNPEVTGRWTSLATLMPINPVHVALLNTGKVLVIAGSGNDPDNRRFDAGVWDPVAQTIRTFRLNYDMFCNGMVILHDGRPFVLGGTIKYDNFLGEPLTSAFSPATEDFAAMPRMRGGRWYPTGTVLGNGSIMAISGLNDTDGGINPSIEIFRPASNAWSPAGTAFPGVPLYPRQHVLPNGKVFVSGANPDTKTYDPATFTWTEVARTRFGEARDYGTSVLLPLTPQNQYKPRVMILGGGPRGQNVTATTEIIDLSAVSPAWTSGPNMVAPRIQLNATILPNGKILVSGGSSRDEDGSTAVKEAQLYDPASNTFSSAGTMEFARLYHSNTLLLPDGTVMAVGGNPERKVYEPSIEIYSPPYLFTAGGGAAERPVISGAPGSIYYGGSFQIQTPYPSSVRSVVLIRAGAVTHAFDMEQRYVGLAFTAGDGTLEVQAPASGNYAPPGYYLLFLWDSRGVPSVGRFVHLVSGPG
jgi:hypothetical protein